MKNKQTFFIVLLFISLFINSSVVANEQFSFDVSEINILENGNKIIGSKRGKITTIDGIKISADSFIYEKIENILKANGNVIVIDEVNDYEISTEEIIYNKKDEIIYTKGNTVSEIHSRYSINSENIIFLKNEEVFNSNNKTTIIDNENQTLYSLKKFNFVLNDELLKGKDILVTLNYNQPINEKLYFENVHL